MRRIATKHSAEVVLIWVKAPSELAKFRATSGAHLQNTRILGDMPEAQFDRISKNLQKPRQNEPYIEVDGTKITDQYIKSLLPKKLF